MPAILSGLFAGLVASSLATQTTAITGATLIDGRGGAPIPNATLVIANGRITAAGAAVPVPAGARRIDASGKWIIPGLMDANVHLVYGISLEYLGRYEGHFEDVILEAAQVGLKNGLTTMFDSWGPLQPLLNARDRINQGKDPGSRLFVAGNIIGFTGPIGRDFNGGAEGVASKPFTQRINRLWEVGTGPELMWLTPDSLRIEIRKYAALPLDFLKYGVSGHTVMEMLMFSPEQQRVIIEEGHRAGKIVQTHSTSVESLRQAIELGVDLMQHCTVSGRAPIPESTIRLMIEKRVWCAVQPMTEKFRKASIEGAVRFPPRVYWGELLAMEDQNERRLIAAKAPMLLATDAGIMDPDGWADLSPAMKEENSTRLGEAHFYWFQAMKEKGAQPMDMILAATRNIAMAYHKLDDFGTLEPGKRADLLILNADPLADINNVQKIATIMKDGVVVDPSRLPVKPILTASAERH